MKETVLITGANSFIARHVVTLLKNDYKIKLLTRTPQAAHEYAWNLAERTIDERALDDVNYIIHLAGSKLNDGTPLTPERKQLVRDTRIGAAHFLREKLQEKNQKIKSFVSASAIGYYGYTDLTLEIDENGEQASGFGGELCADWEKAADLFKTNQVAEHVAKIRVSLVLGNDGGIFPIYKHTVLSNPNIALQSNPESYPWNHIDDMAGIFAFAVTNHLDGVYNSVAPVPASLQDIYKILANQTAHMHFEIQPFTGQHLVSHRIVDAGYQFKFPNITSAITDLLGQSFNQ
jgi:uncharacterized protein (TIGR01777 family)